MLLPLPLMLILLFWQFNESKNWYRLHGILSNNDRYWLNIVNTVTTLISPSPVKVEILNFYKLYFRTSLLIQIYLNFACQQPFRIYASDRCSLLWTVIEQGNSWKLNCIDQVHLMKNLQCDSMNQCSHRL